MPVQPSRSRVLLTLFAGVLATASASILIRFAQQLGAPSITIAAGRMGFAALILLPLMLARAWPEVRALRRSDLALGIGSGVMLALHFASWITSLEYTSVASSAALVATNPLWVGLAGLFVFRERLSALMLLALALTLGGSVLIALSDSGAGAMQNSLLGDGLAVLGALAAAVYFLIGRALRRRLSTLAYVWLVYSSAAVVLLGLALALGWGHAAPQPGQTIVLGYPLLVYALLLGLALGPQLLGHTSFNWALRFLSPTFIAIAILGEPIGAAVLALLIFGETFAPVQLAGLVLLMVGIVVAIRAERTAPPAELVAAQHHAGM